MSTHYLCRMDICHLKCFGMLCLTFMATTVCHLFYLMSRDNYHYRSTEKGGEGGPHPPGSNSGKEPAKAHSFNDSVILRVSPPEECMTISPWLRFTTEGNLSPHSTSTILLGVTSSSMPRVSSWRSVSMR